MAASEKPRRMSVEETIKTSFPMLMDQILAQKTDHRLRYIYAQLLSIFAENNSVPARLEPLTSYTEVKNGEVEGLIISNPEARVFVAAGCKFLRTSISGQKPAFVFFGSDCDIKDTNIACHGLDNIFVAGFSSRLEGLFVHTYGQSAYTVLGPGTTTQSGCNFCVQENSNIIIGSDAMLSTNVFMRTSDSHGIYDAESGKRINPPRSVVLHPHVWVSRSVTLNKGTEVGSDTIIGQGSVAQGKLLANCIYAGAPAEKVRTGITWDRRLASELAANHNFATHHFLPSFSKNLNVIVDTDDSKDIDLISGSSIVLSDRPSKIIREITAGLDEEISWLSQLGMTRTKIAGLSERSKVDSEPTKCVPAILAASTSRVACMIMQKNESDLLPSWIAYHSNLFGLENIYLWDNGSTDPNVIAFLKQQAKLGLNVYWSAQSGIDFRRKGVLIGERIRDLQTTDRYDFFIPIDCDEFLALDTPDGPTTDALKISNMLDSYKVDQQQNLLGMNYCFTNVLGKRDAFRKYPHRKSIIRAGTFKEMDHGFHYASLINSEERIDTSFTFVHYHYKPYKIIYEHAMAKMRPYLDVDDPAVLLKAAENNRLAKIVLDGEAAYNASIGSDPYFTVEGLASSIESRGADLRIFH